MQGTGSHCQMKARVKERFCPRGHMVWGRAGFNEEAADLAPNDGVEWRTGRSIHKPKTQVRLPLVTERMAIRAKLKSKISCPPCPPK